MTAFDTVVLGGAVGLSVFLLLWTRRRPSSLPYPPGPKPVPILGNALDMPKTRDYLTFEQWGKQYGDVCGVTVLGSHIIILSSLKALSDLLEKKGATTSGRPYSTMIYELIGLTHGPSFTNDMDKHRKYRKMFAQSLNPRAAKQYLPIQLTESRKMMARLLDDPQNLREEIKRTIVSAIFLITYGYQIKDQTDRFVNLADETFVGFIKAGPPPPYLVDYIPLLKYIPAWFPGGGFKKEVAVWRSQWNELLHRPFELVKGNMAAGTAVPSFTSRLLDEPGQITGDAKEDEELIMWSSGTFYLAGSDTTLASVHTLYLCMMLYPEVQAKAQAELDAVVGRDRMPTFDDSEKLPYCVAIAKEVLRWNPVGPLGVPRTLTQDEEYEGFLLPKGAMILPNIWAIMHDPVVFPSPEAFRPERFLSPDGKSLQNPEGARDFSSVAFGLGRRACPGAHLAENSLIIAVLNTLWTFTISNPESLPKDYEPDFLDGLVRHPKEFPCNIEPRFPEVSRIVGDAVGDL